jgi:hypothetical protein
MRTVVAEISFLAAAPHTVVTRLQSVMDAINLSRAEQR